jgi:hypothetical protein
MGQKKADYERVMNKFVKYYNAIEPDSIINLWPIGDQANIRDMWNRNAIMRDFTEYGTLKSVMYLGEADDDKGVIIFKAVFSKSGTKAIGLTLDEKNHLGTFRFTTSSPGIDKLLEKNSQK